MGDMVKGFFLLVLLIAGSAVAYATWLVLIPVTESDAEFRLSNVCYGGQWISSLVNGASHRPVSCACVNEGLVKAVGHSTLAKGADALRQMVVAQMWSALQGERPAGPDKTLMADRDVVKFVYALKAIELSCAMSTFGPVR